MKNALVTYWRELSKNNEALRKEFELISDEYDEYDPQIPPFFFQHFRPDGNGLEPYFNKHPYGKQIYKRIKKLYDATSNADPAGKMFIADNPKILTKSELVSIGEKYIRSMKDIFKELDMTDVLSENITIYIFKEEFPKVIRITDSSQSIVNIPAGEEYKGDTENAVYDTKNWFCGEFETDSDFEVIADCLYNMLDEDRRGGVVNFILWPLFARQAAKTLLKEPYEADFELWEHNAKAMFADDKTLHIYIKEFIE
jgi:hypothetical protein